MFFQFMSAPPKKATLVLKPDDSGRQYAGFYSGAPLELTANEGETIGAVMDKFNTYRGPDQQITCLYTEAGHPLPFHAPIHGRMTAIVKR
jgi:hypothetical protein